jgi:hypothetical protein
MPNSTDLYVPMPMTCHPHYGNQADAIRSAIPRLSHLSVVAPGVPLLADYSDGDKPVMGAAFPTVTLDVKKCVGPAPFVGDPIWQDGRYEWKAAVDPLGRHVAGEAHLEIMERPVPDWP